MVSQGGGVGVTPGWFPPQCSYRHGSTKGTLELPLTLGHSAMALCSGSGLGGGDCDSKSGQWLCLEGPGVTGWRLS